MDSYVCMCHLYQCVFACLYVHTLMGILGMAAPVYL